MHTPIPTLPFLLSNRSPILFGVEIAHLRDCLFQPLGLLGPHVVFYQRDVHENTLWEFWEVSFKGRGCLSHIPLLLLSVAWNVDVTAGAAAAILFLELTLRKEATCGRREKQKKPGV